MTRINVIPVQDLCDQHLIAEHREMTRIPNKLASGKTNMDLSDLPKRYTVRTEDNLSGGKGHERFFINKLAWLRTRYGELITELKSRGFKHDNKWPVEVNIDNPQFGHLFVWYDPDRSDKLLNFKRIVERTPKTMRYCGQHNQKFYEGVVI